MSADVVAIIPVLELRVQRAEDSLRELHADAQQFYRTEWPALRVSLQAVPALKTDLDAMRRDLRDANMALLSAVARLDHLLDRVRDAELRTAKKHEELDRELASIKRFTWLLTGGGIGVWGLAQLLARVWRT